MLERKGLLYKYWIFHHTIIETGFKMLKSSEHEKLWRYSSHKSVIFLDGPPVSIFYPFCTLSIPWLWDYVRGENHCLGWKQVQNIICIVYYLGCFSNICADKSATIDKIIKVSQNLEIWRKLYIYPNGSTWYWTHMGLNPLS